MHQPPPENNVVIKVEHLSKNFYVYKKKLGLFSAIKSFFHREWEAVPAVRDVTFSIQKGEFVGLLGPNGAGKTTIVKMLSGILSPDQGGCKVNNFTPLERKHPFLKKIALVMGQKSQLIWDLPPIDSFFAHGVMYEIEQAELQKRIVDLADMLDVSHVINTPARQLSLGERMKCELILAFLHEPEILFLDEPTIGLDASSQIKIWDFLKLTQRRKCVTIILTSHYAEDIEVLCSRVLLINKGGLCFDGSFSELMALAEPEKKVMLKLAKEPSEKEKIYIRQLIGKAPDYLGGKNLSFSISSTIANHVLRELLNGNIPIQEIFLEEAGLSSLFAKSVNMKNEEIRIRSIASGIKKSQISRISDN